MNRINCFVIEREGQHGKEFMAAIKQVWVGDWKEAFHFSNIEDAQRYQADYAKGDLACWINEYPWPQVRLGS